MSVEYRVVSKRVAMRQKVRIYQTWRAAERRMLMFGPEPWRAWGGDPGAYACCSGRECGCYGQTVRQQAEEVRVAMPTLEYARIEVREVGEWCAEQEAAHG